LQLQARITKQSQRLKTLQQSVKSMSKQLSAVNSRAQARVAQYSRSIALRPGTEPHRTAAALSL
jgi:pyrroloquinoline quinone (PQQ) biosynthesis protein C